MATALFLINYVLWSFLLVSFYDSKVHGDEQGFHVLRVETLTPANFCTTSKAPSVNSLKVVYRHGPCFPSGDDQPDHIQMLSQDSLRVAHLQSRIKHDNTLRNMNMDTLGQGPVTLRALNGLAVRSRAFVVTVGIGTPKRDQTVIFDTGSDICWVQCMPCPSCYQQLEPKFDPSASSSYRNIPFTAPPCTNLPPNNRNASGNNCAYRIRYRDSSSSSGLLAMEKLILTNTTAFPNFVFGCGQSNTGFTGSAGLFGLGRNYHSLISQASSNLGRVFSYCLPTRTSISGYLTIGRRTVHSPSYTPMLPSRPRSAGYYFIDLLGITVGRQRLSVPPTVFQSVGTVIDSGATISHLPPAAYTELRNIFRSGMTQYRLVAPISIMDTCYDLSNVHNTEYPPITLHFAGYTSGGVSLVLKQAQVFYAVNSSRVCLGFAPNNFTSGASIIGHVQQRGMDVIYDLASQRIGFAPGNCG